MVRTQPPLAGPCALFAALLPETGPPGRGQSLSEVAELYPRHLDALTSSMEG